MSSSSAINSIDVILGKVLRTARKRAGLSVADLARRINRPTAIVQRYESGMLQVSIGTAFLIASELGLDLAELIRQSSGERIVRGGLPNEVAGRIKLVVSEGTLVGLPSATRSSQI